MTWGHDMGMTWGHDMGGGRVTPPSIIIIRSMVHRKERRRRAILSILSVVVANVPVTECAIVKSVRRAKADNTTLTHGELILLAFIKIPCAIDHVQQYLPRETTLRTRNEWTTIIDRAIAHFRADATIRNKNMDTMDPTYRRHRSCVSTSRESTTGLVYMRNHLMHTLTDKDLQDIQAWTPTRTNLHVHIDPLTNALHKAPFRLGGSRYKRAHTIRTWATALGIFPSIRNEPPGRPFLRMSPSLNDTREWLYPTKYRRSPERARQWIRRYGRRILRQLRGTDSGSCVILQRLRHMTRGDEACLVCEVGSVVPYMTQQHVHAMENAIRSRMGTTVWRHLALDEESHHRGVLWSSRRAADVLVETFQE